MLRAMFTALAVLLSVSVALAQTPNPTCRNCPATYIQEHEVVSYVQRAIANNLTDQQIRAVDVGKANVDIGVVYRGKLAAPAPDSVAEHDQVSEVYHIIEGAATLVTGPDLVDAKPRPADSETVRLFNGPGFNAASIRNGTTYELRPGDVIIIPAGTGHWFTKIDDHITYLMVRIDPDKVTPHKNAADSNAYLANPAKRHNDSR